MRPYLYRGCWKAAGESPTKNAWNDFDQAPPGKKLPGEFGLRKKYDTRPIGNVPSYLGKVMPQVNDHEIGNHAVQMRPMLKGRRKGECGENLRFGFECGCPTTNDRSGQNPCGYNLTRHERDRVFNLATRTNDWCNVKTNPSCAYRCSIRQSDPCPTRCTDVANLHCPVRTFNIPCTYEKPNANNRQPGEHENCMSYWMNEVKTELHALELNSRELQEKTRALENNLEFTDMPLSVNRKCLTSHQKRMDYNGRTDEVEETLCQEKHGLIKSREKMDDLMERAQNQIMKNCQVGMALSVNYVQRHQRKPIDMQLHQLKKHSTSMAFHPGIANTNSSVKTPEDWLRVVRENVWNAHDQRNKTQKLCQEIEKCIAEVNSELWHRVNITNNSFNSRLQRIDSESLKLQKRLHVVKYEIREHRRTIELIHRSIYQKEMTKNRIDSQAEQRRRNMDVDVCGDKLMAGMKKELKNICLSLTMTKKQMAETEEILSRFRAEEADIEHQLAQMDHDSAIDTNECMSLRQDVCIDGKDPPHLYYKKKWTD